MTTTKVDFSSVGWGSVEWTNLVTLYLRAYESRSPRPILGDHAAAEAVDRIDYDFKRMHRAAQPWGNQYPGGVARQEARRLDGRLRAPPPGRRRAAPRLRPGHPGIPDRSTADRAVVRPGSTRRHRTQAQVVRRDRHVPHDRLVGDRSRMAGTDTVRPSDAGRRRRSSHVRHRERSPGAACPRDRPIRHGELLFDTLSPSGPRLSKIFTKGIVKWGIRDAREIEAWSLGLHFVEQASAWRTTSRFRSRRSAWSIG